MIIDSRLCPKDKAVRTIKGCLKAGVKIIQYRDKGQDIKDFLENCLAIRKATQGKALFIVNDRADIAWLCRADGLHIGQEDLPVKDCRKILGPGAIIGKSCHSLKQALQAEKEGVDYLSIGPIFKTPTKPEYQAVGLKLLKEAASRIKVPIAAIGGINQGNLPAVKEAGARMIAVVRAVCQAGDIAKAVNELNIVKSVLPIKISHQVTRSQSHRLKKKLSFSAAGDCLPAGRQGDVVTKSIFR